MKIPLRFQNTEYDCGPTSFINALSYLYEREELPSSLLKDIYNYTLDEEENKGTSRKKAEQLAKSFIYFAKDNNFNIDIEVLTKEEVTLDKMKECLNNNGVIIARCYQQTEHYVLITKIDENFAYIFDPYYLNEDYYTNDEEVAIVLNEDFTHNRLVKIERLFSEHQSDFSLMEKDKREIIIIKKNK